MTRPTNPMGTTSKNSVSVWTLGRTALVLAAAMLFVAGCRRPVDDVFEEMNTLEAEIGDETQRFASTVRTLSSHWEVGELDDEATRLKEEYKDLIRRRYEIQRGNDSEERPRHETLSLAQAFLKESNNFLENVKQRRRRVETMKEMTDESAMRWGEITSRAQAIAEYIETVRDEKERRILESKLLAIQKQIEDSRFYLQSGMQQLGEEGEVVARKIFDGGMNTLDQVDVTLTAFVEEVREAMLRDQTLDGESTGGEAGGGGSG